MATPHRKSQQFLFVGLVGEEFRRTQGSVSGVETVKVHVQGEMERR